MYLYTMKDVESMIFLSYTLFLKRQAKIKNVIRNKLN